MLGGGADLPGDGEGARRCAPLRTGPLATPPCGPVRAAEVCIDQENIGDGLKVLPVNVMACTRMVALCGDTYAARLWCAWELFILCTFMQDAGAGALAERLQLVPLGEPANGAGLSEFDVRAARCYDPNEERRLRTAIDCLGADRFNTLIREMSRGVAGSFVSGASDVLTAPKRFLRSARAPIQIDVGTAGAPALGGTPVHLPGAPRGTAAGAAASAPAPGEPRGAAEQRELDLVRV